MNSIISLLLLLGISVSCIAHATSEISLRDKIGQMLLIGFEGKEVNSQSPIVKTIEKDNIGGVILFDYNYHSRNFDKNIETPEQVRQLNNHLQYYTQQANLKHHRPQLPLLISVDYEGGQVTRLGEQYGFPSVLSAAEIGKNHLMKQSLLLEQ